MFMGPFFGLESFCKDYVIQKILMSDSTFVGHVCK